MAERQRWNERRLAEWLRKQPSVDLTLSQCWQLSRALCQEPLADVWLAGLEEGRNRYGAARDHVCS